MRDHHTSFAKDDQTQHATPMENHGGRFGNGGTTLYQATDPASLENQLKTAFTSVAAKTASGTAASILSNSEGSGALLLQAVFYPRKYFDNTTSASWIGEIQNLWYYVDPFIGNSSTREDTTYSSGTDHYLDLKNSYVASFTFDGQQTNAYLSQDANADGAPDTAVSGDSRVISTSGILSLVSPDSIKSLWRGGRELWKRDISSNPRGIYTYLKGISAPNRGGTTVTFSKDCLVNLVKVSGSDGNGICYYNNLTNDEQDIIQYLLQAPTLADAEAIIAYAHGSDNVTLSTTNPVRSRKVRINSIDTTERVWKLGDIIDSTPRIESFSKLNNYSQDPPAGYSDKTYGDDISQSGYIYSNTYKNRGMAFVGANDGMLHAFNLGQLSVLNTGSLRAKLSGTNLGEEKWAFIPRNALPYLKYLLDPLYSDKNHLYLVDGSTRLVDASVGCSTTPYYNCSKDSSSWRTILIGSMGIGGASRNGFDSSGNPIACADCVKTPLKDAGRSSYFALDVTDPTAPKFLWEFSHDDLGYTTSDPAVVRINTKDGSGKARKTTNGHWYAVFGNGPTGPISNFDFLGRSDKALKIFVLDLLTGTELRTSPKNSDPAISNAFMGRMGGAPVDVDRWNRLSDGSYSDNALYFGYTNYDSAKSIWDGGVLRLMTSEDPDPNNWTLSKVVDGTGPVTASVAKIQDRRNHNLWLYFGGGRYFYRGDDQTSQRNLIAVKEPCYQSNDTLNANCSISNTFVTDDNAKFKDQTTSISTSIGSANGWFIQLDGPDAANNIDAERVITDPSVLSNGAVIFTSYKPSNDACSFGGESYLWAMRYDTGGVAPAASRNAQVLVQVSTGEFKQVSLSTALTASQGRKMGTAMTGKPPIDAPPIVSAAGNKPYKRILHVQEK